MKIFEFVGKIIDLIGKNLSRIKTVGVLLLIILFSISVMNNGCNRKKTEVLIEKITGLNIKNDILSAKNSELNDSLISEVAKRKSLDSTKNALLAEKNRLTFENKRLKDKLQSIPEWLLNLSADSSYKFLCEIAYPFPGEKKYPFNEPQVKNIHADYLENATLNNLVVNLENQLVNCGKLYENADSASKSFQKSYVISEERSSNFEKKAMNNETKAVIFEKENKKEKFRKVFWRSLAGAEAIAIIILLL